MGRKEKSYEEDASHSGVIGYRIRNGATEVLLVTASGSGRWVIPKGRIEEDVGSRESARREAFEEAGAEGEVEMTPFDRYLHGDDELVVEVFLMRVSLESPSWPEEEKRKRRWVSIVEADDLVEEPGLRKLLRKAGRADGLPARAAIDRRESARGT